MSGNPYSSPVQQVKGMAGPTAMHPMQPLYEVAGWLKFLGWLMIILGVIYCLTIIGIIFGWLPIWMGLLLKGSGEKLKSGFTAGDNSQLYDSSRQLSTYFTIMGVLAIIGLALNVLYFGFLLLMLLTVGLRGMM